MGMTRKEAIEVAGKYGVSSLAIDALVALGVLKVEEAKKLTPIESLAEATGYDSGELRVALDRRGLQVVEKNDAKEAAIRYLLAHHDKYGPSHMDYIVTRLRNACK